jgi:hypothetical protein
VRDNSSDGTLTIMRRESALVEDPDGSQHQPVASHFSIHPSAKTDGTKLKYTRVSAAGREVEDQAFVANREAGLLCLVWSSWQWAMGEADNLLAARAKDQVYRLVEYDERATSLLYSVWVCDNGRAPPEPPSEAVGAYVQFRNFTLAVYLTQVPVPALSHGHALWLATSTRRLDKGPTEYIHTATPSTPFNDFQPMLREGWEEHRKAYMRRLHVLLGGDATSAEDRTIFLRAWDESGRFGVGRRLEDLEQSDG